LQQNEMKNFFFRPMSVALLAGLLTGTGSAIAAGEPDLAVMAIQKSINRATGLSSDKVKPSSTLPGYYEIEVKGAIAYVDPAGKRLIRGDVIDLQTGENLTASRLADAPASIDVSSLPISDALKTVKGSGQRKLYIFVDPNCSFCKQLEPELAKLTDVTIYRFVLAVLGPGSQAKARQVWCSSQSDVAWGDAMAGKTLGAEKASCDDSAITRNAQLARKLGVSATPTIVFSNGARVAAAMTSAQLEERMNAKVGIARAVH
jgi:thiol:disulfide interchange protein DsbC